MTDLKEKITVGKAAFDLLQKPDTKQSVVETQKEMQKNYVDELIKCAKKGEELYGKDKSFYLCVQTRRERTMVNVIRNQFYPRQTRPEPAYDLALYYYDPKVEQIQFVWCIPDKETTDLLGLYGAKDKNDEQLAFFCKSFLDRTLI